MIMHVPHNIIYGDWEKLLGSLKYDSLVAWNEIQEVAK